MDITSFGTDGISHITVNDVHQQVGPDYHVWITNDKNVTRGRTMFSFSRKDGRVFDEDECMKLHDRLTDLDHTSFLGMIKGIGRVYEDGGKYGIHYNIDR